jgi:hypothetical protein
LGQQYGPCSAWRCDPDARQERSRLSSCVFEDWTARERAGRGYGRHAYVHHLVAEAFHGPRPNYLAVARHLNDVKTDNRLENVAWGTRKENAADMRRNREKAAGQEELAV